jgi:hypothetical protein
MFRCRVRLAEGDGLPGPYRKPRRNHLRQPQQIRGVSLVFPFIRQSVDSRTAQPPSNSARGRCAETSSIRRSPNTAAISSRPLATVCWSSSPARSRRCAVRWKSKRRSGAEGEPAQGPMARISRRHQPWRYHLGGRRYLWRWSEHRGPAGNAGRADQHLDLRHRLRSCPRALIGYVGVPGTIPEASAAHHARLSSVVANRCRRQLASTRHQL